MVAPPTVAHMQATYSGSYKQQLPIDVLAVVLQHVDQSHRLCSCALVSQSWRQAANLATSAVQHTAQQQPVDFDSLSAWLQYNAYVSEMQTLHIQLKSETGTNPDASCGYLLQNSSS